MSRFQHPELADAASIIPSAPADFDIRVLGTVEELINSYKLRYHVFADVGYLQHPNSCGLEIDAYDERAVPFGAFDTASGAMVGTLRLITRQPQCHFARLVREVVEQAADHRLEAQARGAGSKLFPSIASKKIEQALAAYNTDGLPMAELSRIVVDRNLRGSGVSRRLMEFGIAHASVRGPTLIIGSFLASTLPMYARYGYVQLPETNFDYFESVGQVAIAGVCRTDRLPELTRSHVEELLGRSGAKTAVRSTAPDRSSNKHHDFQGMPGMAPGTTGG